MVFLENSKNSPSLYHMLIVSALRRGYVRTLTQGSPMGHLWVTFFIGYKAGHFFLLRHRYESRRRKKSRIRIQPSNPCDQWGWKKWGWCEGCRQSLTCLKRPVHRGLRGVMGGWEDDFMMSSEIQERPGKKEWRAWEKGRFVCGFQTMSLWLSNGSFEWFKRPEVMALTLGSWDDEDKNNKNTTHDGCGLRANILFFRPWA